MIDLHNWRIQFNGSKIGYGYDQYKKNKKYDYPEAYAFWGNGYLNIYRATQDKEYLNLAVKCSDWLLKNNSSQYTYYSWGLPWEWNKRPKETSYVTTSIFVGNFLLNMFEETSEKEYLDAGESIGKWILEENGYRTQKDGIWFNYSDHPSLQYPIFNAISMASGFFSRLYYYNKCPEYENLSRKSAFYTVASQQENGAWNYSNKSNIIDNVHTGFTIEGLLQTYQIVCTNKKMEISIKKAIEYYRKNLYTDSGFGYERKPKNIKDAIVFKVSPEIFETRLIGYASGIRVFTKHCFVFGEKNYGETIAKYVIKNIKNKDGSFIFKNSNKNVYIRNEAHIFDALSLLFAAVECRQNN